MSRLLLVSNRLPLTVKTDRGDVTVARSDGGLASGLRGPHQQSGGQWIGWPGDVSKLSPEQQRDLDTCLAEQRCVPVHLSSAEIGRYYDGFSNAVLWPLFHYLLDRIPPHSQEWDAFRDVNEKFADAVARAWRPGDLVWIHDYQLMLVPGMLRARIPEAASGFFLHIPFPASEVLRTLPWREQILEGMLGADLVGFHTLQYRSHFSSSVLRILGLPTKGDRIQVSGRSVRLGVFPIGVDVPAFTSRAADPAVTAETAQIRKDARGERILLGIDRLDYTKGIPLRLLAFERLLERRPNWRGKIRMVQVCVPSRVKVPSYQDFRAEVDGLVGRINGAFSTVDWVPIHYVYRPLEEGPVVALYRAADVMLVTPLRDGMNLVAKEFVASRVDEDGVLVLSEFAGAAAELREAVQVNPYDVEATAQAYDDALTMPEEERRDRMRVLRARIAAYDVHRWATSFLEALGGPPGEPGQKQTALRSREDIDALGQRLRASERLLLLLDYDGTLVPFARAPELASPDRSLRELLASLARRPGFAVHVVSGRRRETLERWLGELPIGLHAEHGYWSRMAPDQAWEGIEGVSLAWKPRIRALFDQWTLATPGALVEEKTATLAWHFRMAEPELGAENAAALWSVVEQSLGDSSAELLRGDKVIEVRPRVVTKARVAERVLGRQGEPPPTIVAMGDDGTDEDMFRVLPPVAFTISVGPRPSAARYRVATPGVVRDLLERLL